MYESLRRPHYVRLQASDDDGWVDLAGVVRSASPSGFSTRSSKRLSGVAFLRSFLPIFVDEPEKARPKPCARVDEKAGGLEPDTAFTAKALHAHGYTTIFVSGFMPDEDTRSQIDRHSRKTRRVVCWPW